MVSLEAESIGMRQIFLIHNDFPMLELERYHRSALEKIQNKFGFFMRFHRRQLENAVLQFEEVQNKFGFFMCFHRRHLEIAVPQFEEVQKKPAGFFYFEVINHERSEPLSNLKIFLFPFKINKRSNYSKNK